MHICGNCFRHVRILENEVGGMIHYASIPREQNIRADLFVNQAIDVPIPVDKMPHVV